MRRFLLVLSILTIVQANAQNFKFGKVSKEEISEKEHPGNKEANAAVLYRGQRVYYDFSEQEGLQLVTEIHERIKIYNKEGFDWATKEIKKYKSKTDEASLIQLKGYTYNLIDGKVEEEKLRNDEIFEEDYSRYNEVTKFTMPAVKEGSVIEYIYKIKSPFLGSIGKTSLQYLIPLNKLELEVKIPEFFAFSLYFNLRSPLDFDLEEGKDNFSYTYSSSERSGFYVTKNSFSNNRVEYMQNVYSINQTNIPALKEESHVDNLQNYAAFIDWELMFTKFPNSTIENYSEDWEGVAKSIYSDVGIADELNRDSFYDKELDEVLAGLSDPMMKVNKIFNYVKHKVKWNDYLGFSPESGTKKAFKEGSGNIGDINILLTSMLKYAGINAHPVVLSTTSHGIPLFPTRNGFNYVVAGVEFPDNIILMDASDPFSAVGELPKRARNWQGRIIRDDGTSAWINLRPNIHSQLRSQISVKVEEGSIVGRYNNIYEGLFAKDFRNNYFKTNERDYLDLIKSGNEGLNISDYHIENKENVGQKITEKYNFELTNSLDVIGNKIYMTPLLFDTMTENPFKTADRVYPIFFDFPEKKSKTVNIMIPSGYKVASIPESSVVNLGDDWGQFRYIVHHSNSIIRVTSEVDINKTAFLPSEYEFLKKFYDNIIKKQSEAIVLEKELEDGFEERADSGR
ncbi:DUF3857 domain-containing protein [Christiangramia forsetii]|uniref:Transglutaminase-like domain-containing protein n=2 Tax=Christiangramia forsetii TaxID=411153 RepID=A0LY89_CHRFK|nr:DUF3857 domain-containing protein [Christiangramia forsetii]GGG34795.1 hypothetical protein GCM10011532_18130 [Christiangramia forsetii]CAL65334.1 conserved hypothetical protein, secreted [Christiangramia forsetii KT0803]